MLFCIIFCYSYWIYNNNNKVGAESAPSSPNRVQLDLGMIYKKQLQIFISIVNLPPVPVSVPVFVLVSSPKDC